MSTIEDIWEQVFALAKADGVMPLNQFAGCWYRRLDEKWAIAINAHYEEIEHPFADCPHKVPPFSIFVLFNGWPAGVIDPYSASIAAGAIANIDTFVAALRAAMLISETSARPERSEDARGSNL